MKKKKYINIFKKEDGAGLVLALMVLMVLAVLGVVVAGVTIGSHKLGDISRDSNSAYYIAEAGANLAYKEIENAIMDQYNNSSDENIYFGNISSLIASVNGKEYVDKFDPQFGDQPKATIKISEAESVSDGEEYTIISTGEIAGKTRTVEKPFKIKWIAKGRGGIGLPRMPEGAVIMTNDDLYFENQTVVKGDVYLGGDIRFKNDKNRKFEHTDKSGIVYNNSVEGFKEGVDLSVYENLINSFPSTPDTSGYEEEIKSNEVLANTNLSSYSLNKPLTIHTDGGTINLVVGSLTIGNSISVEGTGIVNVFVTEKLTFSGNHLSINAGGVPTQFNIIYAGDNQIEIRNHMVFNGTFFIKQANISIWNHLDIQGIIIFFGSKISMHNHAKVLGNIYAPKSLIDVKNHIVFQGGLVAGSIESGIADFIYEHNTYLDFYPFGDGTGGGEGGNTPGGETSLDQLISAGPALEP